MARTKICGLSTAAGVSAAMAGGADFIGFMVFDASPRRVVAETAAGLAAPVRGKAKVVAVTVDPDDALIDRVMAVLAPDFIQLHGRESPARVRQISERSGAGVIRAIGVSEASDIEAAREFEDVADHLMFDARPPAASANFGGAGVSFDWSLLAGQRFERPWFLAGGLDPWNVAEAIGASGAPMVDVSSGVERGAGLKDPALITAFLEAVRRA